MSIIRMNMIVAVDSAFGIAKNNDLPWHLPNEYKHFVKQTTETKNKNLVNAVIMGRKCWESIPEKFRPLNKRINVILSRTMNKILSDDLIVTNDFNNAIELLTKSEQFKNRIETIWNIGGSDIYKLGLEHPLMHKLVITRIEKLFDCDVKFPEINWNEFERNDDFDSVKQEEKEVTWYVTSYTKRCNY